MYISGVEPQLLNHYPGTFYYFEPLHYYAHHGNRSQLPPEQTLIRSLLNCQFNKENFGYLQHVANQDNTFLFENHNFRFWNSCRGVLPWNTLCFIPEFLAIACRLHPVRLVKTVRLRMAAAAQLLPEPGLHVILLVRDPRAVFASRATEPVASWCSQERGCASPAASCADLAADLAAWREVQQSHRGRVAVIRYEDLAVDPERVTRRMVERLGLPWHPALHQFLASHTRHPPRTGLPSHDPYGTSRNSTATAFAWRHKLSFNNISSIQAACSQPLASLGYKLLNKENFRKQSFLPIKKEFDII